MRWTFGYLLLLLLNLILLPFFPSSLLSTSLKAGIGCHLEYLLLRDSTSVDFRSTRSLAPLSQKLKKKLKINQTSQSHMHWTSCRYPALCSLHSLLESWGWHCHPVHSLHPSFPARHAYISANLGTLGFLGPAPSPIGSEQTRLLSLKNPGISLVSNFLQHGHSSSARTACTAHIFRKRYTVSHAPNGEAKQGRPNPSWIYKPCLPMARPSQTFVCLAFAMANVLSKSSLATTILIRQFHHSAFPKTNICPWTSRSSITFT